MFFSDSNPTPVAFPVAVTLGRPMDLNEKVRQIAASIHARHDMVDQLPSLLLFLAEVSSACMRSGATSPWLTEESFSTLVSLFGPQSRLVRGEVPFVLPLATPAIPSFVATKLLSGIDNLVFVQYLSAGRSGTLLNFSTRSLALNAADYFYFSFVLLPLLDLSGTSGGCRMQTEVGTSGGFRMQTDVGSTKWHDGSITVFEQLMSEYVEASVGGAQNRGCQLLLATVIDLYLDIDLFGEMIYCGHILRVLARVLTVVVKSNSGSKLGHVFMDRLARLLADLFSGSSKFLTRIDMAAAHAFVNLWSAFCQPWLLDNTDQQSWGGHIARFGFVYACYPFVLRIGAVRDFVSDYAISVSSVKNDAFSTFLALKETKLGVELFVAALEVLSAVGEKVVNGAGPSSSVTSATRQIWAVARECTWHNGSVPKALATESWRMDTLVNRAKGKEEKGVFALFVWETGPESDGIPKNLAPPEAKKMLTNVTHLSSSWNQPVCASEYASVIGFLRKWVQILTEIDLEKYPKKFTQIRILANVSVLILLLMLAWLYAAVAVFPDIESRVALGSVQLVFASLLAALIVKWIGAQYII